MGSSLSTCASVSSAIVDPDGFICKQMFHPPILNNHLVTYVTNIPEISSYMIDNDTISILKTPQGITKKWVIFSHGNAANIFQYYDYILKLHKELGVGCIFYDYPGYGLSTGHPTDKSCVKSLKKVVNHMVADYKIQLKDIILMGQSIGTGVVMEYAYKSVWKQPIILVSPYKSIITVATESSQSITQYIDKYPSLKYIQEMTCPIKIFHGTDDNIIPITHGMALHEAMLNDTFNPLWLNGVGHNDIIESIPNSALLEVINY